MTYFSTDKIVVYSPKTLASLKALLYDFNMNSAVLFIIKAQRQEQQKLKYMYLEF